MAECPICGKPASKECSACHSVSYCSAEHQKSDWKCHKKACLVYEVKSNEKYGRYTIATRDIPAGTIVMNESATMIGPKQETLPICLGCNSDLCSTMGKKYYCSKCRIFPMCGPECEKMPIHANNECRIFSSGKLDLEPIQDFSQTYPIYECIMVLRCLLLKEADPRKWRKLTNMTNLNEFRKEALPGLWQRNSVNTVNFLRVFAPQFAEDDIHSVLGYFYINAFEVKFNQVVTSGLFDNIYLMAHDCVPNTHHTFTEDYKMVVRTTIAIKKGEMITTTYTNLMDGTLQRRQDLRASKFFECACARCSDPTELGTYFSAVRCHQVHCPGYLLPTNPLSLSSASLWSCTESDCSANKTQAEILTAVNRIKNEMEYIKASDGDVVGHFERLVKKYRAVILHPNHFLMVDIESTLLSLYGRRKGWGIGEMSLEALERKEELGHHVLSVVNVLQPGLSAIRGIILYELNAAIYFGADRLFTTKKITPKEFKCRLEEVIQILDAVRIIFFFDAVNTSEGRIAKSIPANIARIRETIRSI